MDFHGILVKPIQIVKEILDLEPDLESPSLAIQFVVIKNQLAEVQAKLNESNRIAHKRGVLIAKLRKAIATNTQPRPAASAFVHHKEIPSQAEPAEELKLPTQASCALKAQEIRPVRTHVADQTTPATLAAVRPTPSEDEVALAKAKKARSIRARVLTEKAGTKTTPKPSSQEATPAKANKTRSIRTRVTAKKTAARVKTKTTPKPKRSSDTRKS